MQVPMITYHITEYLNIFPYEIFQNDGKVIYANFENNNVITINRSVLSKSKYLYFYTVNNIRR